MRRLIPPLLRDREFENGVVPVIGDANSLTYVLHLKVGDELVIDHASGPLRLLYGVARDIPDAILDMAVTHGADLLLLGTTKRGTLWKAMKGDVIQAVAEQLPEGISLLIHA